MAVKIHSVESPQFAKSVSDFIVEKAVQSISERGLFRLVLSGGRTPVSIFQELVKNQDLIDWEKVKLFWVDERCVPVDSPDSNYGTCRRFLLDQLEVQPESYPMYRSGPPTDAAQKYESVLKQFASCEKGFVSDLVLLGVGVDGHVASLFPGACELQEEKRWVVASTSPFPPSERISMTFPVINCARNCLFILKGAEKKWVFEACSAEQPDLSIPACNVSPASGETDWFVSFE